MSEQMVFKRYEIKFMLTRSQRQAFQALLDLYMIPDEHGKNTTLSLYLDRPDFLLARRSMEHPFYKEKLRLRSYGTADADSTVFIELKKKCDSIVYKRRAAMKESELETYLAGGGAPFRSQIMDELDFTIARYEDLRPAVLLCYNREAWYGKDDREFRITFDENILWRDTDVRLTGGIYGERLTGPDQIMMEVKAAASFPGWLVDFLSRNRIYKTSFSKYSEAYRAIFNRDHRAPGRNAAAIKTAVQPVNGHGFERYSIFTKKRVTA